MKVFYLKFALLHSRDKWDLAFKVPPSKEQGMCTSPYDYLIIDTHKELLGVEQAVILPGFLKYEYIRVSNDCGCFSSYKHSRKHRFAFYPLFYNDLWDTELDIDSKTINFLAVCWVSMGDARPENLVRVKDLNKSTMHRTEGHGLYRVWCVGEGGVGRLPWTATYSFPLSQCPRRPWQDVSYYFITFIWGCQRWKVFHIHYPLVF